MRAKRCRCVLSCKEKKRKEASRPPLSSVIYAAMAARRGAVATFQRTPPMSPISAAMSFSMPTHRHQPPSGQQARRDACAAGR